MVNDMGIDPDEWFDDVPHPHDSMPVARHHDWEDTAPSEYEPKDIPPELMEVPTSVENPKPKKKEETMHEKMYQIATARNNPFHVGGSENVQSEIDYIKKHSPWAGGSENFQGGSEEVHK